MKLPWVTILSAAAIAAAATNGPAYAQVFSNWSLNEAEEVAGQKLFMDHCAACHVKQPGHGVLAPSLKGVVGRPAGSVAGFQYSEALKNSGLTWTEDNLRKWIMDNAHMVPGTLMPHVSIADPAEALYLVAYLKSASGTPKP